MGPTTGAVSSVGALCPEALVRGRLWMLKDVPNATPHRPKDWIRRMVWLGRSGRIYMEVQ